MNKKPKISMLQGIAYLSQVGLSFATPIILILLLANWLVESNNWPVWVYIPAMLIGLLVGFMSLLGFAKEFKQKSKKNAESSQQTIPNELKGIIK